MIYIILDDEGYYGPTFNGVIEGPDNANFVELKQNYMESLKVSDKKKPQFDVSKFFVWLTGNGFNFVDHKEISIFDLRKAKI